MLCLARGGARVMHRPASIFYILGLSQAQVLGYGRRISLHAGILALPDQAHPLLEFHAPCRRRPRVPPVEKRIGAHHISRNFRQAQRGSGFRKSEKIREGP